MCWFTYIVECADGSFYVGITNDLWKRLRMHNGVEKGGAKYTRSKRPVVLRYYEIHPDKATAAQREYILKQLNHTQKKEICDLFTCRL